MCNTVDIRLNSPFQEYTPSWYEDGQEYIPSWAVQDYVHDLEKAQGVGVSDGGEPFQRKRGMAVFPA